MAECFPFWAAFNKTTELDFCLSGNPLDVSTATYDNVSYNITQDTDVFAVKLSSNGTKMFVVSNNANNDSVYQYALSTPWDVSSATYGGVFFSVLAQDSSPSGLAFNSDGSKMYVVGLSSGQVHQYTLSTNFDISTATYDATTLAAPSGETVGACALNIDGTKVFLCNFTTGQVLQYTMATAFDISTATYDSISASVQPSPFEAVFNSDGTTMLVLTNSPAAVYQYDLSQPYDLSTATYSNKSLDVSGQDSSPQGIALSSDDTKLYVLGTTGDSVYQYTL